MSLVGTRPPTVDEWDKYELHHRARLATKPGLTGMWQVSGRSNITDLEKVLLCDELEAGLHESFLFHYLEKVSSLSCGPVEIYDRSRYQQWRYDCDPEAIEKKMGKQR